MSYYSPSFSNIDRPMAPLPTTRVKAKGQAIPPSVASGSPHEFPSVHSPTLVHLCTLIKCAIVAHPQAIFEPIFQDERDGI